MTNLPRLLRTDPAARHCGFRQSTFEKWRCTGEGPKFIRRGKSVFYDIEDLNQWLKDLPRYGSTSEADAAKHAEAKLAEPFLREWPPIRDPKLRGRPIRTNPLIGSWGPALANPSPLNPTQK